MVRYGELLAGLRRELTAAGEPGAELAARELTAYAAGKTVAELLRDRSLYVPAETAVKAERLLREYLAGKPLAYILGEWSFFGLTLKVTPDVLIPRDDTMAVTTLALEALEGKKEPRVLDLCTGSGCIGIALASQRQDARVTLADISEAALAVAKENVHRHGLERRVNLVTCNALYEAPAFLGSFDLIVSNPPYITGEEMKALHTSVADYEPHLALYGGEDGLDFYRAVCHNYAAALREGGCLCFEFGLGQQDAVGDILRRNSFEDICFRKDASNIIRAVSARKKGKE